MFISNQTKDHKTILYNLLTLPWKKIKTQLTTIKKRAKKNRLTFAAPHNSYFRDQVVESVLVPGLSGDFCILVGHVPTIAQLRPGLVTVTTKVPSLRREIFTLKPFFSSIVSPSSFTINRKEAPPTISSVEDMPLSEKIQFVM